MNNQSKLRGMAFLLLVSASTNAATVFSSGLLYQGHLDVAGERLSFNNGSVATYGHELLCADQLLGQLDPCPTGELGKGGKVGLDSSIPLIPFGTPYDLTAGSISLSTSLGQSENYGLVEAVYNLSFTEAVRIDYTLSATAESTGDDCNAYWSYHGTLFGLAAQDRSDKVVGYCADGTTKISGSIFLNAYDNVSVDLVAQGFNGVFSDSTSLASEISLDFTVTAVPVPAAVWLFGSALAGLGWFRRRQTA